MKSAKVSTIASTLSPYAKPFTLRSSPLSAEPDSSVFSSPVFTYYSSLFQPEDCFSEERAPTPVSMSPCLPYISPNSTPTLCDFTCPISSDDISSVDSPCYKGRIWSQVPPLHIGETSTPPLVTIEKLGEEPNLSFAVTPVAYMIDSDKKEKGFSVSVLVGPLDFGPDVGTSGDISINQNLDPRIKEGSRRKEMLLQKMVHLSDMLLQIPSNAAGFAEGDDSRVKIIMEGLDKLLEESEKGSPSKRAKAYGLDKEKGKEHPYSASCTQKRNFEDNEENIDATIYKNLWINAEIEKWELKYKLQHARMVDTGTNKSQKKAQKI